MNSILNGAVSAILPSILPTLLELFGLLLMAWLVRLSLFVKAKWGIEIEARHREALHSAVMSGIRAALSKGLTGQMAVTAAIEHVTASVPDAIAALSPSADVLSNLVEAKLREALPQNPVFMGVDFAKGAAS